MINNIKLFTYFFLFLSVILSEIPPGYYNSANGLSGTSLQSALHEIINNHTKYPYTSSNTDVWDILKTCFDPEIPVNIVDLGLIYDMKLDKEVDGLEINIKMTLTAPGCGMGPVIAQDVEDKLMDLSAVTKVIVDLVWDPVWNQAMMTDSARLELGML